MKLVLIAVYNNMSGSSNTIQIYVSSIDKLTWSSEYVYGNTRKSLLGSKASGLVHSIVDVDIDYRKLPLPTALC